MAGRTGGGGHAQCSQRRHRVGRTFPGRGHQEHVHDTFSSSTAERRPCSSASTSDTLRQSSTHDSRTESRPLKLQNTTVNPGGHQVGTRWSTARIRPPSISVISELSRQMMDQIRPRFPESCMAALEMFKPLPLNYYMHHLGQPTRSKFATL